MSQQHTNTDHYEALFCQQNPVFVMRATFTPLVFYLEIMKRLFWKEAGTNKNKNKKNPSNFN